MVTHEEVEGDSSASGYDSENAKDHEEEKTPLFDQDGTKQKRLHSDGEIANVTKRHRPKMGPLYELRTFFKSIDKKHHWDKVH